MRSVFQDNESKPMSLNMTPMIDVIFLLLIFFVCTAGFDRPEELLATDLSLPGVNAQIIERKPDDDFDPVTVRIANENGRIRWRLEFRECESSEELLNGFRTLSATKRDVPVIIDCDGNVPVEYIIDALDAARSVGLQRIQFAAQ